MTVMAIYEDGVFKPLTPVDLPEHTRVEVTPVVVEANVKGEKADWSWRSLKKVSFVAPDFDETPSDFKDHLQ